MNLETNLHVTPSQHHPRRQRQMHYHTWTPLCIPYRNQFPPPNEVYPLVTDILRATRSLLDTDHDWILPNIALLEGQLPVYDTLIGRLCTVVEDLKGHRHAIQIDSKRFSSTLAPIRGLSTDVLLSVFRETRSTPRNSAGKPNIELLQDPLTLGQVCGSWRDIIISSPALWSDIKLVFPDMARNTDNSGPSALTFLQTVLPLSGQHPLDIQFASGGVESSGEATEVFAAILEERHRWRNASLVLPFDLKEQLRVTTSRTLACLESLIIRTSNLYRPNGIALTSPEDVSDVCMDAPCLQKVELNEPFELGNFAFPRHITHLATVFTSFRHLPAYSQLEELHLTTWGIPVNGRAVLPRLSFLAVRRLSISSLNLLLYLRLPSLEDLTFDADHSRNFFLGFDRTRVESAATTLYDFLYSSRCSLASLATGTSIVYASKFIQETLPILESLTSLEFQIEETLEGAFYDALTSSSSLLPNLQHLIMCRPPLGVSAAPLPRDALSTMLASRRQHLRSVRFDCAVSGDTEHVLDTEQVETLRDLGVELKVVDIGTFAGIGFGNFR